MLNHYIALSVVINIACSSDYVYQNLLGSFHNRSKIEISVISDSYNGFYIYGFDFHGNKILVKFDEFSGNNINITFNEFFSSSTINNFCGCSQCKEISLIIFILIEKDKLTIKCNENTETIIHEKLRYKKYQNKDDLPEKISMKIGNSKYQVNKYLTNSKILGCLDQFLYNKEIVNFNRFGKNFLITCMTEFHQKNCNQSGCFDSVNKQHMYYCSRTNHLKKNIDQDTLMESIKPSSFTRIGNSMPTFTAKLTLTFPNFSNYCLFELKLKDENIQFHINQYDKIILSYRKSNQIKFHRNIFLNKVVLLTGYTIMLSLNNTAITLKICHKNNVYKYMDSLNSSTKSIYVGMTSEKSTLKKFNGSISVLYDSRSFSINKGSFAVTIILILFGILLLTALIIGFAIYLKSKKNAENQNNAGEEMASFVAKA